ncbi:MAG TPA: hypothetical protein VFA29_01415 [Candidatus Baltobacteraceae bacterium]|nr:hypothetical protein [Candidatus Baltobacteraceae bacterium]
MLSLILAAAAAAAPAAPALPADGSYTYVSSMNGAAVGKTVVTIKRTAGGVVLSEQGGGTYNGQQGTLADTLTLDPSMLAPTNYSLRAVVDGRPVNAALAFKGASAVQSGDMLQKTYDLTPGAAHFVVLDVGPFSGWFALPAQLHAWNGAPALAIVPEFGSGVPIAPDTSSKAAPPAGVPAADASISVTTPMPFTLWYDPAAMLVDRLDFPTQGITINRTP